MRAASRARLSASHTLNPGTFVQNVGSSDSAQVSGTTLTITVPTGGIPVGHTLIVRSATDYLAAAPTLTDSRSNAYTSLRSSPATGNVLRATIHGCPLTTALLAGDTITMTVASGVANRVLILDEFAGVLNPLGVDAENGSSGTSTTPDANVASTYPVDLVVAAVASTAPLSDAYTQDATWNALTRAGTSGGTAPYASIGGGYRTPVSTNTWHYRPVTANADPWIGLAVALKA